MNIVYVHGLDSDANSAKGLLLKGYCEKHYPNIKVHRPDLNLPPPQVLSYLTDLVTRLSADAKTVLVGSSLGGYFSTLVSNQTGCPILLLNPSTKPHITLQRFEEDKSAETLRMDDHKDETLYTTPGGWEIKKADLQWFAAHQLTSLAYPNKVVAFIKKDDELLDANISAAFYQHQGARVIIQQGGDHRFSDFAQHLPEVIEEVIEMVQQF